MDSFSGLSSGLPGPRPVASSISHSSMISICNHAFQQIATSRLKTTEETKSLDPLIYGVGRLSMLRTVLFSRRLLLPSNYLLAPHRNPYCLLQRCQTSNEAFWSRERGGGLKSAVFDKCLQRSKIVGPIQHSSFRTNISSVVESVLSAAVRYRLARMMICHWNENSVAPHHSLISIKRWISRVEDIPKPCYCIGVGKFWYIVKQA